MESAAYPTVVSPEFLRVLSQKQVIFVVTMQRRNRKMSHKAASVWSQCVRAAWIRGYHAHMPASGHPFARLHARCAVSGARHGNALPLPDPSITKNALMRQSDSVRLVLGAAVVFEKRLHVAGRA